MAEPHMSWKSLNYDAKYPGFLFIYLFFSPVGDLSLYAFCYNPTDWFCCFDSSLFVSSTKPRPNQHPVLLLFVVGGLSCTEIRQIRDALNSTKTGIEVYTCKIICILKKKLQYKNTVWRLQKPVNERIHLLKFCFYIGCHRDHQTGHTQWHHCPGLV